MLRRALSATCIVLLALACAAESIASKGDHPMPGAVTPDVVRKVDEIFAPYVKASPGCILGITENQAVAYEKGYGLASLENDIPIKSDTVFQLASMSKQFTAMSIIILAHQGKVSLNDDIRRYVPEIPKYGSPITIWNLIHHTSGLRDIYVLRSLAGLTEKDYFTNPEFLDIMSRQKHLVFPTGSNWRYSNSGYVLLGIIVERVSHQSLAQFAAENIFRPLGMTHTFYHDDSMTVVKHRAYSYLPDRDNGFKLGVTLLELVGDGGVDSTIDDLMRWDRDFYVGKVWKPEIKADMLAVGHLNDGSLTTYPGEDPAAYAGGVVVGERRGLPFVRHSGSFIGFKTDQIRFPEQKLGITLLCNLDSIDPAAISNRVADVILAHAYTKPAKVAEPAAPDAPPPSTPVPLEILQDLPGIYHSNEIDADYRIVRSGNSLRILMGRREVPLDFKDYAASAISLIAPDTIGDEVFAFRILRSGKAITGFDLSLVGGSPMRFARLPSSPPAQ